MTRRRPFLTWARRVVLDERRRRSLSTIRRGMAEIGRPVDELSDAEIERQVADLPADPSQVTSRSGTDAGSLDALERLAQEFEQVDGTVDRSRPKRRGQRQGG